jgi:hypothetical protein
MRILVRLLGFGLCLAACSDPSAPVELRAIAPVRVGGPFTPTVGSRFRSNVWRAEGVPAEHVDEVAGQLVAADHLLVLLEEGRDRSVVEAAAASVHAEVVGQVPQVGLYQLRLPGASPEALAGC